MELPDERLAVIPARGGSKRVPGKNVRLLGGRPLVAFAIEAALASELFATVVVSTDSAEIARIARDHGAEVPFLREADIADDLTPVSVATVRMLQRLDPDAGRFDAVCQLMPNCPFVEASDVRASFRQFCDTAAEAQISVVRFGMQNPWWALQRDAELRLTPLFPERMVERSQDLPALYCPTGAVWWARADVLRRYGTFHAPTRTGWEIPWERGIDIDTEDDVVLAEILVEHAERDRRRDQDR